MCQYVKRKLNHGDTVTLSYTGVISVFLREPSAAVVKKQFQALPNFAIGIFKKRDVPYS